MSPASPPRTHLIGCGRLGLSLGRLFAERGWIEPADVLTRSIDAARAATAFIGGGRAVARVDDLGPADLVFVWTPDSELRTVAEALAGSTLLLEGVAVVHASGALSSEMLAPLRARGAAVASVHPIRSFAAAERLDDGLDGVVCGAEGDAEALAVAVPIFEAAGARAVRIEADAKPLYHAAAVLACNHLVGLIESAVQVYAAAGIDRDIAMAALAPLVRGTVDNVFARGPAGALSGPIVRGEAELVSTQISRLDAVSTTLGDVYRALAHQTLGLARGLVNADAARLDALERALARTTRGVDAGER
jgi:predicted short-subunit dehydrogenase-like oxidoreductase (DUF2520 family)